MEQVSMSEKKIEFWNIRIKNIRYLCGVKQKVIIDAYCQSHI